MLLLLEVVERFTHLGTQISKDTSCEAEISRRITITRDCVRTENPAAPYLAFEHHGSDQGTAAERICAPSLRNDLYCVEWGVKLYSLTHSPPLRS